MTEVGTLTWDIIVTGKSERKSSRKADYSITVHSEMSGTVKGTQLW